MCFPANGVWRGIARLATTWSWARRLELDRRGGRCTMAHRLRDRGAAERPPRHAAARIARPRFGSRERRLCWISDLAGAVQAVRGEGAAGHVAAEPPMEAT